ncbi:MAG: MFS transporter [Pseudomonadota bacterium]
MKKAFPDFSLLVKNRDFGFLYVGQFTSMFGGAITRVAIPFQIYLLTHSTLLVGLLSLCQLLPLLFTALIGGVIADQNSRKKLLIITEIIICTSLLLLAWNANLTQPSVIAVFLLATISSAVNGLHRPALEGITQQVVKREDYAAVGALRTFKMSITMIAGPALSGIIIAAWGITLTYLIDFICLLASLLALLMMRHIPKPETKQRDSIVQSIKTGCRFAFSRQALLGSYLVDFNAMLFAMPNALFPAIAVTFGGAKTLGMLYAAPAIGTLLVSTFSGWTRHIKRHGAAIAISAGLWGLAIILFGLSNHLYAALLFLMLAGGFDAVSMISRMVLWNEVIPKDLRGRLAGIEMLSYISGPRLGDAESGIVASIFGITASIVSGGVLCVISVAACCYYLPKFWHYRSTPATTEQTSATS